MRSFMISVALATSALTAPAAQASEGRGQPFIAAEFYQKNISMEQFRVNPRNYFRSEMAFDLIVDYVGDEIGQPISGSEFVALMRDETQTRVRDCAISERINTGALLVDQFNWFGRQCRSGEQIVQVLRNGRWIDLFSLNCLNAVEDQTPVNPPQLTTTTVVYRQIAYTPPQRSTIVWQSPDTYIGGSIFSVGCCCDPRVFGTPSIFIPGSVNVTTDFGF